MFPLNVVFFPPRLTLMITAMNSTLRPGHRPEHDHPVRWPHIQRQGSWQRPRPVQRPQTSPPSPPPPRLGGQGALCNGARRRVRTQALPRERARPGEGEREGPALVQITQRGSRVHDAQTGGLLGTCVHVGFCFFFYSKCSGRTHFQGCAGKNKTG